MKGLKNIISFTIILVVIINILTSCKVGKISNVMNIAATTPIKVGVLIYNDNTFTAVIANSLKDIQRENENRVEFDIFDAKSNPAIESEILNSMFNANYNFIIANIEGKTLPNIIEDSIKMSKQKNIPIIFFNVTPVKTELIKSYSKAIIVNTDSKQAGIQQGEIIANAWNNEEVAMDKNLDGILQYIMIKGEVGNFATNERTTYSISTINNLGIKTQELASVTANWDKEVARVSVESYILKYNDKIEAIIANNDAMAIGAIEALQKYGYNTGDKSKTISVFGINGRPEAQELIKKGFMAGSVPQNPRAFAEALYTIGMNLVSDKSPTEGTNYKIDESGVVIRIAA